MGAAHLFDGPPNRDWTEDFLGRPGHHLLMAFVDGAAVGFVSGVEMVHPDKPVEMFVYELGVDATFRRRGIATALLRALESVAREDGQRGLWVVTEPDNHAARATYAAVGAEVDETVTFTWST